MCVTQPHGIITCIQQINKECVRQLNAEVDEYDIQKVMVSGGAGVMKRFGGREQKNIQYLEDVKANAKGYEMLGNAYLAQAQKRKIG